MERMQICLSALMLVMSQSRNGNSEVESTISDYHFAPSTCSLRHVLCCVVYSVSRSAHIDRKRYDSLDVEDGVVEYRMLCFKHMM